MKKITIEKIDKYYKNAYLIISTITLFLFILLLKNMFYNLFNISINNLAPKEKLIINITYNIFGVAIAINFLVKNKDTKLEEFKKYLKKTLIGISAIFIYSITSILELAILYYSKVNISTMTILSKTIYLISCELLIMSIIALIYHKKLEKDFIDVKKNFNEYFTKYLKLYIIVLIVMMLSNLIINTLTQSIATNEETIRNTFTKAPIYMFFSAVIFAPFTEEMIFRQSLKNIIINKKTFIIASGLIFGGLHVIGYINTIYDVLYIIPYSAPGIAFAYMLEKTDNIFVPMGIHFLHNSLLMTLQVILLFT